MIQFFVLTLGLLLGGNANHQNNTACAADGDDIKSISTQQMMPHFKHLSGVYSNEVSLAKTLEQYPEQAKNPMFRPQNILVYRVWDMQGEWWYYIGWYSPTYKEKALDEAFFQFKEEEGVVVTRMYSVPNDRDFSMEWTKKTPFAGLERTDLEDNFNTILCSQEMPNGGVRLYSPDNQPYERKDQSIAAYKYVNFDMHFYPKYMASQTSFLDADQKPVMIQSLDFTMDKVDKSVKTF